MRAFVERIGAAASALFAIAAAITVYEVIARYVFNAPTSWGNALTTTLCAVAFALGGAYCMVRDEHIRITSLVERLSAGKQRIAMIVGLLCGLVYLTAFGYAALREAVDSVWRFEGERWAPEPTPGPPNWPLPAILRVMLTIAVVLFLLAVIRKLVLVLRTKAR